ncbi:hypothetical protein BU26DRAFT_567052 [Trematosphaeria pertusa]|uniref:Uncharacterized protein n=1 Tax=Trematosphaeria pertusa TaxID=390896 RepID=A0A6A6I9V1_9PLEO|nr:uncharacterized protein BU26DRAFT_567052 [Trematosphaeria pertusa]KAF2246702.1 hypothetical protein BU26DRAFT_567052 [Trematosphaeria pertusa]
MVVCPEGGVHIDLDKDTSFLAICGMAFVSREVHRTWTTIFFRTNIFHLQLAATDTRSSFSEFRAISRLLRPRNRWRNGEPFPGFLHITLTFNLKEPASLDDIRVPIVPLLLAVPVGYSADRLRFVLADAAPDRNEDTTSTIALCDLHLKVCDALAECRSQDVRCRKSICPQIWIDGRGQIVECVMRGEQSEDDPVAGAAGSSRAPAYPWNRSLESVFRYLAWQAGGPFPPN